MREFSVLRPQDVLVLLKLLVLEGKEWKQLDLVNSLHISPAEISHSLKRLREVRLIDDAKRDVLKLNAIEFILYGVKYVFPAKFGPSEIGIGTAHSAPPLSRIVRSSEKLVWPYAEGDISGEVLQPIYATAPQAALSDSELYELLALLDAVRVGRAREKEIATKELKKRFA